MGRAASVPFGGQPVTALNDLKKYPPNTRLAVLTTGGVIISGEVDHLDAASVVLVNSTVGSAAGGVAVAGRTITVYLEDVSAHWDVNS